ncbi:thioredoxin family protein [Flagellimonas eckloniae]|uniref:Thioredoxin domain-containing protein n=1 Tax=Flagellimonas eckloniae TaxID=346185 RepID=A0A0N8WFP1_9FLAO|nr:thioredoxin family protein [Allomuricauda eckloniae]KQC29243.1 hypothetical protein AAY42_04500 [Allomuricauda eckloniae]
MKFFLSIIFVLFTYVETSSTDNEIVWHTDFEDAKTVAKKEKKNILIYFTGSDWCSPCKKLKTDLFDTNDFKQISKKFTLLYVDIPRNHDLISGDQMAHNKKLLSQFNKKGVFPLFKIVKSSEKIVDEYSGYSMNGDVSYHLDFFRKNQ